MIIFEDVVHRKCVSHIPEEGVTHDNHLRLLCRCVESYVDIGVMILIVIDRDSEVEKFLHIVIGFSRLRQISCSNFDIWKVLPAQMFHIAYYSVGGVSAGDVRPVHSSLREKRIIDGVFYFFKIFRYIQEIDSVFSESL